MKKDYGQAMKYFEDSHRLFLEVGDQEKIIRSMNNLGNLHSDLQLYEQALKYYSQAFQLSEKSGKVYSDPLNNIGNLYFRQGNYQKAVEYYERGFDLAKKENNKLSELNIIVNLGEVYARAGRGKEAQQYLDQAMTLSQELQAYVFEPQILKSMAGNYARQNKMNEAYQTMVKYDVIKEKIYGEESSRKIAQMEMALDIHEKEKQMEALKQDDEIKTLQLRNTRMIITAVVLAIVVTLAGINLFMQRKKQRRK